MGNIFEQFNELNRNTSNDFIKKCRSCELKFICAGGCRVDNYNRTGNMLSPICDEKFKENIYRDLLQEYLRG